MSDPMTTGGTPAARKCRTRGCDNNRVPGAYYCSRCLHVSPLAELERRAAPTPAQPSLAGDAQARKAAPMASGFLHYFPNAVAAASNLSKVATDQHHPGQDMHWAFTKSTDEADCIMRHLAEAGTVDTDGIRHSVKVLWRAAALVERELLASDPALKPGKNVKGFERK